jgi:hypothetical protein
MTLKGNIVLSDPLVKPDEKIIFSVIGEKKILWQEIMNYLRSNYPDAAGDWNFYKDGKQWLFKMVQKKKTIFWSGLFEDEDTFRITFYFGDKAEPVIDSSDLPQRIKSEFKTSKRYGAIRAVSTVMRDLSDVEIVKKLVSIKTKLK